MNESFSLSDFRTGAFQSRHYSMTPITEAIISLNIELPVGFEVERLRHFVANTDLQYGGAGEERMMRFTASPGGVSTHEPIIGGFRFVGSDAKYALICRTNSFSVSRLA